MKITIETQGAVEKDIMKNLLHSIGHQELINMFAGDESSVKMNILTDKIRIVGNSVFAIADVDNTGLYIIIECYNDGSSCYRAESPFFDNKLAAELTFNSLKEKALIA